MDVFANPKYLEDVELVACRNLPWEKISGKSVLLSGASGLVGSFLVDVLVKKGCKVYALGRNMERAQQRFSYCWDSINFITHDINTALTLDVGIMDYVIHLASNTHPVAYATQPISTITTNIIGTKNMLDFAVEHKAKRFVFTSSNEIYGENRGDVELFDENYCGYIDCNTMRAGYPESKRCGEALCQAYKTQMGLDVVIARLTRSYGPTMLASDTKAISQFMKKAIAGENIVLKSAGTQFYSYTYVADAVLGLLTVLLCGENGEAYNIADEKSDIMLKDLATAIASTVGREVVFEIPDEIERAGYSKATKARLSGKKIQQLGWNAMYDIYSGIKRTIDMLREDD